MHKSIRTLAASGAIVASLAAASTAMAAVPTGDYADFRYCPYQNTSVTSCVYSVTNSGSIKLGNANVPITAAKPVILQGGIIDNNTGSTQFVNAANGGATLSPTKLDVPGGLLGLMNTSSFGPGLLALFQQAVNAANGVTATAELVGPVTFSLDNILDQAGTGVGLPVRIHLENPFLGPNCYIGSSSNPVRLNLTTGTTSPPRPNTPISGNPGLLSTNADFTVLTRTNIKLVNNSFSAPAATGCGYLPLDQLLITGAVNLKEGLPSAAGKNTAILQGNTKLGERGAVAASVR